jgi:hypothetical protein
VLRTKTSGASLAESPVDRLRRTARADIILEIDWGINKNGPKHSVTYNLRGLDAYSNKQVAGAEGTGAPSFSAEIPVLIEEAVQNHMDPFTELLRQHFDDLLENGREVVIELQIPDNGQDLDFESEYGGKELAEIIDEFGDKIPKFYRIIYPDLGSVNYDIFNWHLSPIAISEFLNRYNECEDPKDMEKFFSRLGYSNTRLFNDMDWESVKNMTFFENNTDLDISEKLRKRCYFGSKAKENYPVVASFIRKKYKPSFVAACIRG